MTHRTIIHRLRTLAQQAEKRAATNQHLEPKLRAEGAARAYWTALAWVEMAREVER